jgi:hypothetical protein
MLLTLRTTGGITYGAPQIAGIRNLNERQAGMLFVVGAKPAVVGATPLHRCVVDNGHLRALDEHFSAASVVFNIVGDQHALRTVLDATLQKEYLAVLEDDLPF